MTSIISLILLLAIAAPAYSLDNHSRAILPTADSLLTHMVVIIRDARSNQILSDARIDIERRKEGEPNKVDAHLSSWGEAIEGVTLGRGVYRMKVVSDGYVSQIIEDIRVDQGGDVCGVWSCGTAQEKGLVGRTIIMGIFLEPRSNKSVSEVTRTFPVDTTYYSQPEIAPSPRGGMVALKKNIDLSSLHLKFEDYQNRRKAPLMAQVLIDAKGVVQKVEVPSKMQKEVADAISKGIYSTRFTPAFMLGKAVRSKVNIPFEIAGKFEAATPTSESNHYDVACKNLRIVPSKPRVGERLWVRFDVVNVGSNDIPGRIIDVAFYFDGEKVIWSGGYPSDLKAGASSTHSVAEQYMEPLTTAGPHKYKLVVALKGNAIDVDPTNNLIEGVINVE